MTCETRPIDALDALCTARDGCVLALRRLGCRGDAADVVKQCVDLLDAQIGRQVAVLGQREGSSERAD
jgi:hypothetical protein